MGCEIKAGAVNLVSFWPILGKSIRDGVTGCENSRATLYFYFKSTKQSAGLHE